MICIMKNISIIIIVLVLLFLGYHALYSSKSDIRATEVISEESEVLSPEKKNLNFTAEMFIGTWKSVDDTKSVEVFNDDLTTQSIYDGEILDDGVWEYTQSKLVRTFNDELFMYEVVVLNENQMQLIYTDGRGGVLDYVRISDF